MTQECIESIFEHTEGISFEIILIDNASGDKSRDVFSSDKRITYIYLDENIGFGRANNVGISRATGKNILFLNNDTLLTSNSLKIMSDCLNAHENVGACGCNLIDMNGGQTKSYGSFFPGLFSEFDRFARGIPSGILFGKNKDYNNTDKIRNVSFVTGADLMVKKDVLNSVGGFDPSFFLFFEETELCYRIHKAGFKIISIPYTQIIHIGGASISPDNRTLKRKRDMMAESQNLYMSLCHSQSYVDVFTLFKLLADFSKIPFDRRRRRRKGMTAVSVFPRTSAYSENLSERIVAMIDKEDSMFVINEPELSINDKLYPMCDPGEAIIICSDGSTDLPDTDRLKRIKRKGRRLIFITSKESLDKNDEKISSICDIVVKESEITNVTSLIL